MSTLHQHKRFGMGRARAFTLLELVIVLAVMVGLLAVVWPNLQRPLQRTSLDEAAQIVRDAIDESRYQATLHGTVYFVQLQQGGSQLRSGSVEEFLGVSSDFSAITAAGSPGTGGSEANSAVRTWQLPSSVVVDHVDWTSGGVSSRRGIEQDESDPSDTLGQVVIEDASRAELEGMPTVVEAEIDPANARQWWLPLTADGRGRDAMVELLDASIGQRLRVTYSSATGALEISR